MSGLLATSVLFSETKYIYVEALRGNKGKLSNLCSQINIYEDTVHITCIAG